MNLYPLARRAVASILVLTLAVPVPAAVTQGAKPSPARYGGYAGPLSQSALLKTHHILFKAPSARGTLLDALSVAPKDDAARKALEFVLRAAAAPNAASAGWAVFSEGLDAVPEQLAAEMVIELRAQMQQDPAFAEAVTRAAQAAGGEPAPAVPEQMIKQSPGYAQLVKVMDAWRPGQDAVTRLDELAPAALAWRQAFAKDLSVIPTFSSVAEIAQAFPPEQGKGGGGGFKRRGAAAPEESAAETWVDILRKNLLAVFDADDNLFEFNTVYLFKKGTNHSRKDRIGVSTREWAHIRHFKMMEPGGKYQDYEIWEDVEKGSFWEFRSLPGGKNILLANAKRTLKEKPEYLWQGESFDEFAYFLNDEDAAKGVVILSASGVSPEHFLETLAFLRDQGYFKYLPQLKNIRMVAHPSHPYKGSTASPSEAKVRDMMDYLDERQARAVALGDKAPLLMNADGTRREHLLPAGFSDDDLVNFETMWAGLSPEVKKERWNKLKITIFYTDKDKTGRPTGAYVIQSDGLEREMTADEHNEYYWDNIEKERYGENERPIPHYDTVQHPAQSFDDVIVKMYLTVDTPVDHPKVVNNVDQIAFEAGRMREFIRRDISQRKGWKKRILMERYSISAPEVAEAFAEAVDAEVPVTLATDGNTSLDYDYAPGEETARDFSKARPNEKEAGAFIKRLTDKGYKIQDPGSPSWGIYTQPLYKHGGKKRPPIMHRKALFLILEGPNGEREIELLQGTGNLANGAKRFNRIVEIHDPLITEHALENAERTIEAFKKNLPIHKIRSARPKHFVFRNKESLDVGYTDGKYNFNDRMNAPLKRTVDDPANYKLRRWGMFHFVPGYKPTFELLKESMLKHPDAEGDLMGDWKFSVQKSWGRFAAVNGYLNIHEMGPADYPWSYDVRRRIRSIMYLRGIPGVPQRDLEGPPVATFVFHDKSSEWEIEEFGVLWDYISWGTFNNSGNYHNAEWQWLARLKPESPWFNITRDSAVGHVKLNPQWGVPGWKGPFLDTMARLVGQSALDVKPAQLHGLEQAVKDKAWTRLSYLLQELAAQGTTLVRDTFAPPDALANVLRYLTFMDWNQRLLPAAGVSVAPSLSIQQASLPALALAWKNNTPYDIMGILKFMIGGRELSYDQKASLAAWAWKLAGMDAHLARMQELLKAEKKDEDSERDG